MRRLNGALTVLGFEWNRSRTIPRIAVWIVMALFPAAILTLRCIGTRTSQYDAFIFDTMLLYLIPQVVCLLGLLLWATPNVHSELEGRTWIYLAVRPDGKAMVLLGKYLTAVAWSASACLLALTISVIVCGAFGRLDNPLRTWASFAVITTLAAFGYGALFSLIGVMFHRRAMVVAVAYTVVSEFAIANVPAVINKLTFVFHFRCMLRAWSDWPPIFTQLNELMFDDAPVVVHLLFVLFMTGCLLSAAVYIVRRREYITAEES